MDKQRLQYSETDRGFRTIHLTNGMPKLIVQESSAIGPYDDAFDKPGSSFLWVGDGQLNREAVCELTQALLEWLVNGRLPSQPVTGREEATDD